MHATSAGPGSPSAAAICNTVQYSERGNPPGDQNWRDTGAHSKTEPGAHTKSRPRGAASDHPSGLGDIPDPEVSVRALRGEIEQLRDHADGLDSAHVSQGLERGTTETKGRVGPQIEYLHEVVKSLSHAMSSLGWPQQRGGRSLPAAAGRARGPFQPSAAGSGGSRGRGGWRPRQVARAGLRSRPPPRGLWRGRGAWNNQILLHGRRVRDLRRAARGRVACRRSGPHARAPSSSRLETRITNSSIRWRVSGAPTNTSFGPAERPRQGRAHERRLASPMPQGAKGAEQRLGCARLRPKGLRSPLGRRAPRPRWRAGSEPRRGRHPRRGGGRAAEEGKGPEGGRRPRAA